MPILKTATLGCKVNQYETEYVRQALAQIGYRAPQGNEPADLCVVNTCTVTAESDRKSRQRIRKLAKENPDARIVVMGCFATRCPQRAAALPQVTEVLTDKRDLPALLKRLGVERPPAGIDRFDGHSRVFVKVQDGCRRVCAYCIIPKVRSVLVSRPEQAVLEEVARLRDSGYREIVLTGIHLGHYGVDLPKEKNGQRPNLARLVERLAELDGDFRIRISSIEADEATPELVRLMVQFPDKVCPHLHLSMQSGSDAVLKRMRRPYTRQEFLDRCALLHDSLDLPALTTDLIVGFPGETEADFQDTCRAVEEARFSKVHIFRFSPREGTEAALMRDQMIHGDVLRARAAELARVVRRARQAYFESIVGRPMRVLIESIDSARPGQVFGTSERYVPVELPGCSAEIGTFVQATAERIESDRVVGIRSASD